MAATLVGGAFLTSTLDVLFDRLASKEFINFFRGRKHDESLLKKLKRKVLVLNKVLDDAEDKQFTNRAVKEWLDELKVAVYDAEDLVDEIATHALRCKVEAEYQSGSNQVQSLISSFTKLFDDEIESKLEKMIDTLEDFSKEIDVLGLREVVGRNSSQTRLPTTSLVVESRVYGRENDKEEIMKLLLSPGESSDKVDVISIVGMGGVGKTTLALLLYNDGRLDGHFVKKAWVYVSDIFDVERVTRTIVEEVDGQALDARSLNSLQVKLKESLSEKKFLIVLDDVWNENYDNWNALMTPFQFGERGSKIIVTTRNEGVASTMQSIHIHRLHELPVEDCWELFSQHAFEKGDCNEHPNLERIGRKIVGKCKGLPLAAKTMGCLLRSQLDVKDWNNILESAIWELSEEKSKILPALRLSYHYLPSHLKRCFAFCSTFIKDYEFAEEELVAIWMAEGFLVKPKNNKTVEEEGYECFRELHSRSFFQRSNNTYKPLFVMHDLVHDLAQHVMGDFCYRMEDDKKCCTSENVRHFSYVRRNFDGIDKFKVIKDAKCLRTFLQIYSRTGNYDWRRSEKAWLSNKELDEIISGMPRLRLLSLPRYEIEELPYSIGKLIHLRFLNLSYSRITQLPESVCTLYNLETLLLSNCRSLTTLPADLEKLISLHRLDLSETNLKEMPVNISRLKDLQRLSDFVVGKCSGSGINGMKELNSLGGAITISGLENVTRGDDALEAKLKEKKHLKRLTLKWGSTAEDSQKERNVLENLEPPTNLKLLEIINYGGTKFPTWLGDQSFSNMLQLRLKNCENCFSLPPLGQMPSLQSLSSQDCPEIEYFPEGGLPSALTSLSITNCKKLKSLPEQMHTLLPSLRSLDLNDCPEIEYFPEGGLPSALTSLSIRNCKKLKSLPEQMHSLLPSLRSLSLQFCPEIESFPGGGLPAALIGLSITHCKKLKSLPEQMHTLLPSLRSLDLNDCPEIEYFPEGGLPSALTSLSITNCKKLKSLPEQMHSLLPSLRSLSLQFCPEIESFPGGGLPSALIGLSITHCKKLKSLPEQMHTLLPSLRSLSLQYCPEIESFPEGGLPSALTGLSIRNCKKLKSLPEQMHTLLPSLESLYLDGCPEIESFPEGGLPSKLGLLRINNCKKLVGGRRDWGLQTLTSLTGIYLGGESEDVLESFPEEGLLPPTLTHLCFLYLVNLKSLNGRGLQPLVSLKRMIINDCPQLQSLSVERLPTSLSELIIWRCPLLKPRCRREEGEDWHKIAHIPFIMIDGEVMISE